MVPLIGIGWTEVLVEAGVIFVFFGASRLPGAFRSLGEGLRSFKKGLEGGEGEGAEERSRGEEATASASKGGDKASDTG